MFCFWRDLQQALEEEVVGSEAGWGGEASEMAGSRSCTTYRILLRLFFACVQSATVNCFLVIIDDSRLTEGHGSELRVLIVVRSCSKC